MGKVKTTAFRELFPPQEATATLLIVAVVWCAAGVLFIALSVNRIDTDIALIMKPVPVLCGLITIFYRVKELGFLECWVCFGQIIGMGGDFALYSDKMIAGLGLFLIGHICFIVGFTVGDKWKFHPLRAVPWLLCAIGIGSSVTQCCHGPMKVAVSVYIVIITAFGWRATSRVGIPGEYIGSQILGVAGASFFVFSDMILAINEFCVHIPRVKILVMTTYYMAQLCVSMSVIRKKPSKSQAVTN